MVHRLLEYPFDPQLLIQKKKSIKRELLSAGNFVEKRVAILGGSTTNEIKNMLELFLLNYGIKPRFYESEYGRYWQDAVFENAELNAFDPEVIYIHTSNRNIGRFPSMEDSQAAVNELLMEQYRRFETMWDKLLSKYCCPVIQNNFEMPLFRLLGNKDASDPHGRTNFISRLNQQFYEYAQNHENYYINDINYLSASFGLDQWSAPFYWYMYKYALSLPAIPHLAFSVAKIVKSILGKNKKAMALDLDNTLWGGVIGDDSVTGIEIGRETPVAQAYLEFQEYLKAQKGLGILLNICSKNEMENALAGLNHPEGVLRPEDFIVIKASWQNKDISMAEIAEQLNISTDSLVLIDDNPAEREIVTLGVSGVEAPALDKIERYILLIDRCGFFEVTSYSDEDMNRNAMYQANMERVREKESFTDYEEYLRSLQMTAQIRSFDALYMQRIAQLTNKTNQFNLTTKRLTQSEIAGIASDRDYITLYGKLTDKYGDNGVVTVVIGKKDCASACLNVELWLMSCRVLKRNLEHAMLDVLVEKAKAAHLRKIRGVYYRTKKNHIVSEFYGEMGFTKVSGAEDESVWELDVEQYETKNHLIEIVKGD